MSRFDRFLIRFDLWIPWMKWRKRFLMMKNASFWANRLQEFHFGHLVLGKVTFVVSVVNLFMIFSLKYDFDPVSYLIPLTLVSALLIWFVGRFLEKKKIRKYFQDALFKDVNIGNKKDG